MALNAGDLNRQIVLQELAESAGSSRFPVGTWSTLDTVWAYRVDVSGHERFAANQVSAPFDCSWTIYYRADMDPELLDVQKTRRVLYQNRVYDIVAASQLEFQEGLVLMTLASSKAP